MQAFIGSVLLLFMLASVYTYLSMQGKGSVVIFSTPFALYPIIASSIVIRAGLVQKGVLTRVGADCSYQALVNQTCEEMIRIQEVALGLVAVLLIFGFPIVFGRSLGRLTGRL